MRSYEAPQGRCQLSSMISSVSSGNMPVATRLHIFPNFSGSRSAQKLKIKSEIQTANQNMFFQFKFMIFFIRPRPFCIIGLKVSRITERGVKKYQSKALIIFIVLFSFLTSSVLDKNMVPLKTSIINI